MRHCSSVGMPSDSSGLCSRHRAPRVVASISAAPLHLLPLRTARAHGVPVRTPLLPHLGNALAALALALALTLALLLLLLLLLLLVLARGHHLRSNLAAVEWLAGMRAGGPHAVHLAATDHAGLHAVHSLEEVGGAAGVHVGAGSHEVHGVRRAVRLGILGQRRAHVGIANLLVVPLHLLGGFGEAPALPPCGEAPWKVWALGPGGAPWPGGPPGVPSGLWTPTPSCSWRAIIRRFLFCCSSSMSCIW